MVQRKEKAGTITAKIFLLLCLLLALCLLPYLNNSFANAQAGAVIDLFTDKEPFNGIGANQSSDAFEPQELVFLRALATYNGGAERNMLVAFQVDGPSNLFENVSIVGAGRTNDTGFAEFSFRIPWPNSQAEEIIFGQWFAIATTNIAGEVVVDTITFRVGWIVRVTELTTLNSHLSPQSVFARQDTVVFNMTVENIARIDKSATIKVDVEDSEKNPIIHIEMDSMLFPPGKSYVQTYSVIPVSAVVGLANVSAAAFTAPPESGGRLYSPAVFTTFTIASKDIAIISVRPSQESVFAGETVDIEVTLLNKGNQSESFNVSVHFDTTLVETKEVKNLAPFVEEVISFTWQTESVNPGFYQISALAPLPGDINPLDNSFTDGIVEIKSQQPPTQAHDVAVLNVVPYPRVVSVGQIVDISVTVKNKGNNTESFYVTAYYEHVVIAKILVADLAPSAELNLNFKWNTTGTLPNSYVISAVADTVEGETQTADNTFVDGTVTVSTNVPFSLPPEWLFFFIVVIIAGIAGAILLILLFALDRTRRRRPRSAYTVLAHPHI
jgi:CARDB